MQDREPEPVDGRKELERLVEAFNQPKTGTPIRVIPDILPKGAKLSGQTRVSSPGVRGSRRDRRAAVARIRRGDSEKT
jgi:hypothetical protein